MGKLEKIVAGIEALPADRRADVIERIEAIIEDAAEQTASVLSPAQVAELRRRMADPCDLATPEEVEAFFSRFRS